jgi:putative restriction endonuclease
MDKEDGEDFFVALGRLRLGGPGGAPRLHKPLLVLGVLHRYAIGRGGPLTYEQVKDPLRMMLVAFGPQVKHVHPHYPFWRLQGDGIWEIKGASDIQVNASGDPSPSALTDLHAGQLLPRFDRALAADPSLVTAAQQQLLTDYFDPRTHAAILKATAENWAS